MIEDIGPPLLVAVDYDFCVGVRSKGVSFILQFSSEFFVVVNLTVKSEPHGLLCIRHRLMTACEIDDRQTSESQAYWSSYEKAFVVGPTMCDRPRHTDELFTLYRFVVLEVELACYSAHISTDVRC